MYEYVICTIPSDSRGDGCDALLLDSHDRIYTCVYIYTCICIYMFTCTILSHSRGDGRGALF